MSKNKKTNFSTDIEKYSRMFEKSIGIEHYTLFGKNDISHNADFRDDLYTKERAIACFKQCGALYFCLCHAVPKAGMYGYDIEIIKEKRP
jgi:hypothetical protein